MCIFWTNSAKPTEEGWTCDPPKEFDHTKCEETTEKDVFWCEKPHPPKTDEALAFEYGTTGRDDTTGGDEHKDHPWPPPHKAGDLAHTTGCFKIKNDQGVCVVTTGEEWACHETNTAPNQAWSNEHVDVTKGTCTHRFIATEAPAKACGHFVQKDGSRDDWACMFGSPPEYKATTGKTEAFLKSWPDILVKEEESNGWFDILAKEEESNGWLDILAKDETNGFGSLA